MSELRAGAVGVGFIGTAHARSARLAGARLVGVAASTPARAKEAASRLGADSGFASAVELVQADEIDVVHLCVPNQLHAPLTTLALEAGKHVVCEKPLTTTVASADAVVPERRAQGHGWWGVEPVEQPGLKLQRSQGSRPVEAMLNKRVGIVVHPKRVVTWDHRKLGLGG